MMQCTAEVVGFRIRHRRRKILRSGDRVRARPKRSSVSYGKWFAEGQVVQVPDRWLKFEKKPASVDADLRA